MASQAARAARSLGKGYLPRPHAKTPADFGGLIKDPAVERWMTMRETTTKHMKWTPKTLSLAVFWVAVVPATMYHYVRQDIERTYRADGKEPPHFFPDLVMTERRPDPLPPRKEGVKINV